MTPDELTERLRGLALAAGADDLAAETGFVAERVNERRFHVACVGQFKRGKSTLLNALVGHNILPTGVPPVTSVPTIIRFGALGARARTPQGWAAFAPVDLADYVTEERNPGNTKGVLAVEVSLPAPILKGGLCLVDTPGLGSVYESNSAATKAFVPHIDAALVLLGADPPISGEELRLVETIAAEVSTLLFVLGKVDRVTEAERVQATDFIRGLLRERLGRVGDRVYQVSAVNGGGGVDWLALGERLRLLAQSQGGVLVAEMRRRAVHRIVRGLVRRLEEQRSALLTPLEGSERRVRALAQLREDVDDALRELNPLFAAEEQRLCKALSGRAEVFLEEAELTGLVALRAAWTAGRFAGARRRESLEFANQLARELVYPWLERMEREAEVDYRETAHRFASIARDQLGSLVGAAGLNAEEIGGVPPESEHFRISRHFAFSDRMWYHYPRSPWPALIDALIPASLRHRRRQRRAETYLMDLLTANASRVVGDLAERVRESRREVEGEIRESLRRIALAAADALEWARAVRARGLDAVSLESDRLDALLAEAERLLEPAGNRAA